MSDRLSRGDRALVALLAMALLTIVMPGARAAEPAGIPAPERLLQLGSGDSVTLHVFGQPDMDGTDYVADDGTIRVPLAGAVHVGGLSPAEAGQRVEAALKIRKILVDPHVTITVTQSRSQRVSVLGEVRTPGRYAIESNTTVFDVLALAGGGTENSADVVYVLRTDATGAPTRHAVNLRGLKDGTDDAATERLRGGDSVYVPRAEQFYIYGEIQQPNMYRLEPGMTVMQAIARAGGVTARGSSRRIEIRRRARNGGFIATSVELTDAVQADDVIRIKESIF